MYINLCEFTCEAILDTRTSILNKNQCLKSVYLPNFSITMIPFILKTSGTCVKLTTLDVSKQDV